MERMCKVTVAVICYKPEKQKLEATLRSILLQQNISFEIVIADDGSEENFFSQAESLMLESGFRNYTLVPNPINRGTVYNVLSAVENSKGKYIKTISPGDVLAGRNVLADWIAEMESKKVPLSFADAVYYTCTAGRIQPVVANACPQDVQCYLHEDWEKARYNYLIRNDCFLGSAIVCSTETLKSYLEQIAGKVIYAEDNVYRMMAFDRVPVCYFPCNAVVYEFGTGISTSGNAVWMERLHRDSEACSEIMCAKPVTPDDRTAKTFIYLLQNRGKGILSKILKFVRVPALLKTKLKIGQMHRKTDKDLPNEFLKEVFCLEG